MASALPETARAQFSNGLHGKAVFAGSCEDGGAPATVSTQHGAVIPNAAVTATAAATGYKYTV